jgi:hypothetical protein
MTDPDKTCRTGCADQVRQIAELARSADALDPDILQ